MSQSQKYLFIIKIIFEEFVFTENLKINPWGTIEKIILHITQDIDIIYRIKKSVIIRLEVYRIKKLRSSIILEIQFNRKL